MAYYKIVDSTQLNSDLTDVADAIRTKGGTSSLLSFPTGFVNAVEAIQTGGGSATLIEKSITANGTYNASSDNADGYSKVVANVPNTYAAGDEGKVVSNGALVAQTSDTVTANDTYDTTLINSLTVNVSGGGGGNVAAINILNGVSIVPGYIDAGGNLSSQSSTTREITTDYIDVSGHLSGHIYTVYTGSGGGAWFAYAFYDSSYSIVGSRTVQSSNTPSVLAVLPRIDIPASGVKYVRMSFRTYGHAAFAAAYEPLIDAMAADGWSSYQSA